MGVDQEIVVAEYQRRGVVHFHAIFRLDRPGGPTQPPPSRATAEILAQAVQDAATAITATTAGRTLQWGTQLDIRPVTEHAASYVAKYATKAAECVGVLDQRIRPLTDLTTLPIPDHARHLIATCLKLGTHNDLAHLNLTHWAHMLGFGGHFSTRSRHYGPTLAALRTARQDHVKHEGYVVAHWQYAGRGHSESDAILAAALIPGGPQ
ncbi:replication initiator [Nonomuraea typhae]|uniref:replication initiator n=1 Tax=Nonomuraea typhae TaxID=2603600 RepID=UPI0012FAEEC1|nr:replication initiator [Nonomuraea typhae]